MSDTYTQGTVSVNHMTHKVTGHDTFFKSIGLVQVGSLFTLDGSKYYLIREVKSDTELEIEHLITRAPFAEASVHNAIYTIAKQYARQTNTGLAADFIAFQNTLLQQRFQFSDWLNSVDTHYLIPDGNGGTVPIFTPSGYKAHYEANTITKGNLSVKVQGLPIIQGLSDTKEALEDNNTIAKANTAFQKVQNLEGDAVETATFEQVTSDLASDIDNAQRKLTEAMGHQARNNSPAHENYELYGHNHTHHDLLPKTYSEQPPQYSPIKAPALHFDMAQKKLHALFSSTDVNDQLEINDYKGRRFFYVVNDPIYILLNQPYTGRLSYRVYRWDTGDDVGAIPGLELATPEKWETITVDVVDLDKFGTNSLGNYFYGIVDWICLEDRGVMVTLDKNFFVRDHSASTNQPYIPALGTVTTNTGYLQNPFVEFRLRGDNKWESADMTPSSPHSISPAWTQEGERTYSCSAVSESNDDLEFFSTSDSRYRSMTWAVVVHHINGVSLSTAISNQGPFQTRDVGTKIFEGTAQRIGMKRGYGSLTTKAEILFIKQIITDPDTYGH